MFTCNSVLYMCDCEVMSCPLTHSLPIHTCIPCSQMIKEQLGQVPSHEVQLFSFSQDRDSVLNTPDGRERLKVAGISPPQAVGDWLAGVFESQLEQDEVAKQLRDYVHSHAEKLKK